MSNIVVVGASVAGVRAAQSLRELGYDGDITMIGEETGTPYDRPPLSKAFLSGDVQTDDLALLDPQELDALRARWMLGRCADSLDERTVRVGTESIPYDGLVIATGARARRLSFGDGAASAVHVLRTLADAQALRVALPAARRVVIVGGGFIGTEIASTTAREFGANVTLVEPAGLPLSSRLGPVSAGLWSRVARRHGIDVRPGVGVTDVAGNDPGGCQVRLSDGSSTTADLVVLGVGAQPNVEWLAGSGVELDNGVLTDGWGRTSLPRVVAAGDVARFTYGANRRRVEHWTNARDMPVVAVRALLGSVSGLDPGRAHDRVPYVWTDQFGVTVQVCGEVDPDLDLDVVHGTVEEESFAAVQRRAGRVSAVIAWSRPREFLKLRRTHDADMRPTAAT